MLHGIKFVGGRYDFICLITIKFEYLNEEWDLANLRMKIRTHTRVNTHTRMNSEDAHESKKMCTITNNRDTHAYIDMFM